MACPSSGLPQKVVDAVREKAASVRALRTKWALLARDLLALLTGLRTAVMLDYVAIRPEVVLDLVRGVAGLHSSGQHMVVAQWDDCCYIMRRDLLAERADNKSAVYWLKLAQNGKQKYMGRASPQEAEDVHRQVVELVHMLHAANSGQDVCDLALLQGAFIMPTLNGWLLGYPVVYLVIKENVDSTADFLSTVHLERHITRACCPAFKAACKGAGLSHPSSVLALETLTSFTVPAGGMEAASPDNLRQRVQL